MDSAPSQPTDSASAPIEAEYLESGTFQAAEEDCFLAGLKPGNVVLLYPKSK